jgi:alpha-N-arabinofuranosidase
MKKIQRNTSALATLAALAALTMIGSQAADAALIAHWTFDEGAGVTAADSSGNGLTATTTAATTYVTGASGTAAQLPRFTLADSSSIALADGGTAFTISLWANTTTSNSFAVLAGFEGTGGDGDRYGIKTSSGNIEATIGGAVAAANLPTTSNGSWIHIVAVNDPTAGNSKIYINGVQSGADGGVINLSSITSQFTMGTYWNSNSYDYAGALDDVQVYDEALSASDVTFLFNNAGTAVGVPEPSSTALLGLGGLALILRRRRRRA